MLPGLRSGSAAAKSWRGALGAGSAVLLFWAQSQAQESWRTTGPPVSLVRSRPIGWLKELPNAARLSFVRSIPGDLSMRDNFRFDWLRRPAAKKAKAVIPIITAGHRCPGIGLRNGRRRRSAPHAAPPARLCSPARFRAQWHDCRRPRHRDNARGAAGSGPVCARDGDRAASHGDAGDLRPPGRAASGGAACHRAREPDLGPGRAVAAGVGPGAAADPAEPVDGLDLPRRRRAADCLQCLPGRDQPGLLPADHP